MWRATITDVSTQQPVAGDIFVDGQQGTVQVSQAEIPLPSDGQPHKLMVIDNGYEEWSVTLRGETRPGWVLNGPVRLKRVAPDRAVATHQTRDCSSGRPHNQISTEEYAA
jgi:hypothetical protein